VLDAWLAAGEAGGEAEEGRALLLGDHAPGREAPPIANALDLEPDRHPGPAGPQEVGVE
jgi:hypothetical protein